MTYLSDWQAAKKLFETATGKKKPSDSFLGMFRKSSGMESAAKALDEALKKADEAGMEKALAGYEKARQDYLKILQKADAGEKSTDYSKEIQTLAKAMEAIEDDFAKKAEAAKKQAQEELKKKYAPLVASIPKSIGKIDLFLQDIDNVIRAQTKDALLKLAQGDGGARGYCTAAKYWDQILKAKMPEVATKIYKGTAMADFFPFAQHYGANHDVKWWDAELNKKGDEAAAVKGHADWLKKHIPQIKLFRGYLQKVVDAVG